MASKVDEAAVRTVAPWMLQRRRCDAATRLPTGEICTNRPSSLASDTQTYWTVSSLSMRTVQCLRRLISTASDG